MCLSLIQLFQGIHVRFWKMNGKHFRKQANLMELLVRIHFDNAWDATRIVYFEATTLDQRNTIYPFQTH
jgi:hypothetical protein